MQYVIHGIESYVDHGKSAIVKALTGIDPDRLKEEEKRGFTKDLCFADVKYSDVLTFRIVDVPGHERLVRNMPGFKVDQKHLPDILNLLVKEGVSERLIIFSILLLLFTGRQLKI